MNTRWVKDLGSTVISSITIAIGGGTGYWCQNCHKCYDIAPDKCTHYTKELNYALIRENKDIFREYKDKVDGMSDEDLKTLFYSFPEHEEDDNDDCYYEDLDRYYQDLLHCRIGDTYNMRVPCTSTSFKYESKSGTVIDKHYSDYLDKWQ